MQIGELAAATGVGVQTLRYYERRGLLRPASRDQKGHRVYGSGAVHRVRFIKQAREVGLTLPAAAELLSFVDGRGETGDARALALAHVERIDERVAFLDAVRRALSTFAERCRHQESPHCPLFEELEDSNPPGGG